MPLVKRVIMIVAAFVLVATTAAAQSASSRAWQQRMDVEIPLPVPLVELEAVNPFATVVDETPNVTQATTPRKVEIRGVAIVAAFVDAKGTCLGAVPLELPVPGLTAPLVEDMNGSRFDPATSGNAPQPSWVVLEIGMEGQGQRKRDRRSDSRDARPGEPFRSKPADGHETARQPAQPQCHSACAAQQACRPASDQDQCPGPRRRNPYPRPGSPHRNRAM